MKALHPISFIIILAEILTGGGYHSSACSARANSSTATISWGAVTQDTSGSAEADPLYYNIYCDTYPYFSPSPANFLIATSGTSYQHTDARLADPQVHLFYAVIAVDMWGNESAISARVGEVDYVLAKTKIFLQGSYQADKDSMTTNLKDGGYIPLTSPYSEAPRTVSSIPVAVTDWILIQLRSAYNGAAVSQQSFFLKADGSIVEPDGATSYIGLANVAGGSYYLVLRHRNHLAVMSSAAQTLTAESASLYDFSMGTEQYYGADAELLESGVYGMYTGDTDASGTVDANDRSATWNDRNNNGYYSSDCDLSGTVDANDRSVTWNNRNLSTNVPREGNLTAKGKDTVKPSNYNREPKR